MVQHTRMHTNGTHFRKRCREGCLVFHQGCLSVSSGLPLYNHTNGSRAYPFLSCKYQCGVYWAVQWSWFARVNALRNLLCKKSREVAVSLLGQFMSRRCFTLCITMEVEPRNAKQYKCQYCCSCKNYRGKGVECGKKVSVSFLGWPEDCEFVKKMLFGASYSMSGKLLLVARQILIAGLQKCL